ncbi:MAG: DNA polymerase I [Gammaproteobacteria bacterium]|nr:DNA polymerase I [Gammaproteobacteria bacterium]
MNTPSNKPLILVDGSSYLYRAFHALPPLINSHGEPTGTVFGCINMIKRLLEDYEPEHMAVIFDAKGKTFRDDLYAEYKAHRPPMPDELRVQIEPIHAWVKAMGLPLLNIEGVEADDVIGTLAQQASALGIKTVISTGDKDLAQLVDAHVTLINTMTNKVMDRPAVQEKFGVRPEQIIDYLSLVGDSVDNVPGVPGVGPKTAAKWINEHGSLDEIIANADTVKGKIGEKLRANLDQLPLSRALVTLKCDVKLDVTPATLNITEEDPSLLRDIYQRMEFKRMLKDILKQEGAEKNIPSTHNTENTHATTAQGQIEDSNATNQPIDIKTHYHTLFKMDEVKHWLKRLRASELFAFDLETTSLEYMKAEIVGLSFCIDAGEAVYVPLAHNYDDAPQQLDRNEVLALFKPLLEDPLCLKVGQHIKYDMNVLGNYDIRLRGIAFDTMLESYVLDSTGTRHDMDSLALKYLGHNTVHFEDIAGKGAKQITFDKIDITTAAHYAAEDADITLRLHHTLWPKLQKEKGLSELLRDIEIPLIPILSDIERYGVRIDADMLASQSIEITKELEKIIIEAEALAGQAFNLDSPKQIQEILFNKLNLPILKKTPKGQPSTAENVLQELALDYPLPKLILRHRSLAKLRSTYTDSLPQQINTNTNRVHTSYHQAVAATGRLSSSTPNLQNIPIRSAEGRRIRQAFIAPNDDTVIVAADYSQIELRLMAHLSSDPGLLNAFQQGIDVHSATACEIFGVALENVDNEQRRRAKAINFGLIYGMSAFGLGQQLGIGRNDAQEYIDLYFQRYPKAKEFMDDTRKLAREQGYVETIFGRRLYLPEIRSPNAQRRQYAERAAINAPMQGSAADIIKRAMINIDTWISMDTTATTSPSGSRMIMQVHDELVFEVAKSQLDTAKEQIQRCMTNAANLSVPLEVSIGVGINWDEAH